MLNKNCVLKVCSKILAHYITVLCNCAGIRNSNGLLLTRVACESMSHTIGPRLKCSYFELHELWLWTIQGLELLAGMINCCRKKLHPMLKVLLKYYCSRYAYLCTMCNGVVPLLVQCYSDAGIQFLYIHVRVTSA